MIQSNFVSYPEFREPFFKLVHNIINHCTQGVFELDSQRFETIIHTVIFAMKHEKPEVMEIGLKSMWDLNDRVSTNPHVCTIFYQSFYTFIAEETFMVLSDCRHLSGFKLQCQILQQLINLVDKNLIKQPINAQGTPHQCQTNQEYVVSMLIDKILGTFPNLNKAQVETYVLALFNNVDEWKQFKHTIRDLMISMRSFASTDNEFYESERKVSQIYQNLDLISIYFIYRKHKKKLSREIRTKRA